ncbi:hypothetical protein PG985_010841 [Apiospora marii]|uniref:Uncharacterized protein n=1 Tax=Apiospora marii TaxID=335849 RepID=A0ABR1T245_9PEZI
MRSVATEQLGDDLASKRSRAKPEMSQHLQGTPEVINVPDDLAMSEDQEYPALLLESANIDPQLRQNVEGQAMDPSQTQGVTQQQSQMMEWMKKLSHEVMGMRSEFSKLQEGFSRCEQERTASEESTTLHQEDCNWQHRYEQLRQHPVWEENEVLRQKLQDSQRQSEQLRQTNQNLQAQNEHYFDLLTKEPGSQVLDQEIINKFKGLRNVVYGAVSEVWTPKFKELCPLTKVEHNAILKDVMGEVGPGNAPRFQHHICRIILQTLIRYIFSRTLFGHYKADGQVARSLNGLEVAFSQFVPKDRAKEISQWRTATLRCSGYLEGYLESENETPAHEAEKDLWQRLGPITQHDNKAESLAQERIHQICNDALELKLLMRMAEDSFSVRDCSDQPLTGVADFVIKYGEEPGDRSGTTETVAFCRFGALLKFPIGEEHEAVVLDKAHAIVYV